MPPGHICYSDTRPDAPSHVRSPHPLHLWKSTSESQTSCLPPPGHHTALSVRLYLRVTSCDQPPVPHQTETSCLHLLSPFIYNFVCRSIRSSFPPPVRPPHVRHPDPDFLPTSPHVATHPFTLRHIASAVRDSALPSPGIWSKSWCNQPRGLAPAGPAWPPPTRRPGEGPTRSNPSCHLLAGPVLEAVTESWLHTFQETNLGSWQCQI